MFKKQKPAEKKAPAEKVPGRKAPAKKVPGKKVPAKKAPVKKVPFKKPEPFPGKQEEQPSGKKKKGI